MNIPHISSALLEACYAHGMHTYPNEGCGVLSGTAAAARHIDRFDAVPNILDALHASDPQRYPRNAQAGYVMDPQVMHTLEQKMRDENRVIRVYMHTHVDVGAYFSEEDMTRATWGNGMPLFPEIVYLVCGIKHKQPDGAIWAYYDQSAARFETIPVATGR